SEDGYRDATIHRERIEEKTESLAGAHCRTDDERRRYDDDGCVAAASLHAGPVHHLHRRCPPIPAGQCGRARAASKEKWATAHENPSLGAFISNGLRFGDQPALEVAQIGPSVGVLRAHQPIRSLAEERLAVELDQAALLQIAVHHWTAPERD